MKYKAIIADLDGTAINSPEEKAVSQRLKRAVSGIEDKGIKVCAATGRAYTFAKPVFESMGLSYPAIVSGGSRIVDPTTGEQLWGRSLNETQMKQVRDIFTHSDSKFLRNEWTDQEYLGGAYKLDELDYSGETYIFVACFIDPSEVPGILHRLKDVNSINAIVATSHAAGKNDIHITHQKASKEHAVHELEQMIGVPRGLMIGVGDGANDIHLFDAVGHRVAMGNAVQKLKDVADEVISSIEEDGLAIYLEELTKDIEKEEL